MPRRYVNTISHGPIRLRIAAAVVLVVFLAGCAGKAPRLPEPGAQTPELDERQAQLAYSHFTDGSMLFSMGDYEGAAEAYERALRYDPSSYQIRLSLAESYFRLRQFSRAVAVANAIIPKDADVCDLLGRAYAYLGQNEDARLAYLDLLQFDSTDAEAHWFLSRLAMRRGQLEEAAHHLSQLARYRPASRVYNELGDLYVRMGRPDEAIDAYRRSLEQDSSEANRSGFLGLAGALEVAGRVDEAATRYRQVLAASPEDLATRRLLLHLYLRHSLLDSAIAQVEEILAQEPSEADRIRLGLLLFDTEQYDRAESLFVGIADVEGEESYLGLFYLGRIAEAREDFPAAKDRFHQATVLNDTIPDAWIHWASVLLEEDSLSAALAVAYRGLQAIPDPEPFWYFMGLAFSRHNEYDSAAVWLDKAWRADSTDGRIQFSLAAALERSGRFGEAAVMFSDLLSREPTNGAALNYLGYMYADSGVHLQESLDMIERALDQEPDNGAYLDSFGWVLYRLGRFDEAEMHIRRALEILQSDATIFDHLGDILAARGRQQEAVDFWRRALELDPENEDLQRKLQE